MSLVINSSSTTGALNNQGGYNSKRSRAPSDDEADVQTETSKRTRYAWYFTLERESPAPTDEDKESIYTVQGYETEFARDTSDTSNTWVSDSDSENDVAIHVGVEYELDTRSENENTSSSISSSSEPEDIFAVEFITYYDSEGMVADDSDASMCSVVDSEIGRSAFRTCVQCGFSNNNSLYQYCGKCYEKRKTYFPRPRRKMRSSSKASKKSDTTTRTAASSSQELYEMDSGLGSSQLFSSTSGSSQEMDSRSLRHSDYPSLTFDSQGSDTPVSESQSSLKLPTISEPRSSEVPFSSSQSSETPIFDSQGSEMMSLESQSSGISVATTMTTAGGSQDEFDSGVASKDEHSSSQESCSQEKYENAMMWRQAMKRLDDLEKTNNVSPMLCMVCLEKRRDSVFNHGVTGHQCCCYKCAKKVCLSNRNRCPLCNRAVTYISKIFLE